MTKFGGRFEKGYQRIERILIEWLVNAQKTTGSARISSLELSMMKLTDLILLGLSSGRQERTPEQIGLWHLQNITCVTTT